MVFGPLVYQHGLNKPSLDSLRIRWTIQETRHNTYSSAGNRMVREEFLIRQKGPDPTGCGSAKLHNWSVVYVFLISGSNFPSLD
jgi:hypothetical protein